MPNHWWGVEAKAKAPSANFQREGQQHQCQVPGPSLVLHTLALREHAELGRSSLGLASNPRILKCREATQGTLPTMAIDRDPVPPKGN